MEKARFGQWLQEEREARGWSQAELARRCGKGRSVVHKIENGKVMPSFETFITLALILNWSTAVLFRKMGILPELSAREESFEQWKHLLDQMDPTDEEELRQIAEIKISKRKR